VPEELTEARKLQRAIGSAPVFPAPKDPTKPCDRQLLDKRLRRAFPKAGLKQEPGGLWHTLGRKWATERKPRSPAQGPPHSKEYAMTSRPAQLVHLALGANATLEGVSGGLLILGGLAIAPLVGLESAGLLAGIGAGLLVYAGVLLRVARQSEPARRDVLTFIALDVAWVLGSLLLLLLAWRQLPIPGRWLIAVLAVIVEGFASLQLLNLRRPRSSPVRCGRGRDGLS
jgi:hypothetical protein